MFSAERPFLQDLFAGPPYGIGIFTAALILSIMILPFISAVTRDVFETVPPMLKEAAYGLGCTTWEVMWRVVLPFARAGVVGGAMLALGRALGETMAVTFVIGNAHHIHESLFAPGTTISATIANEFSEATTRTLSVVADRAGPDPVLHHLRRAGERAAHAAHAGAPRGRRVMMNRSLYAGRKIRNGIFLSLSVFAALFGLVWLALILGDLCYNGFGSIIAKLFTEMTPPPASEGGLANAIFGSVRDERDRRGRGNADRAAGRNLSRRIWPALAARVLRALHQRHPAERAVDRHRPFHL